MPFWCACDTPWQTSMKSLSRARISSLWMLQNSSRVPDSALDQLDRDLAINRLDLACQEDQAHAAAAQLAQHLVAGQFEFIVVILGGGPRVEFGQKAGGVFVLVAAVALIFGIWFF